MNLRLRLVAPHAWYYAHTAVGYYGSMVNA